MINKSTIVAIGFAALAAITSSAVTASAAHRIAHGTVSRSGVHSFAKVPASPGIFNSGGNDTTGDMGAFNPGDY
jgi:hypothetical protein